MGATKARFGVAILFCGLLIAISIKGWQSYSQLTDRIYASIREHAGFALDAGRVQYDPVNKIVLLKNVIVSAPGLNVEAASVQLEIVAPGWRDITRQTFPVVVERTYFDNASLQVDSSESLLPLLDFGDTVFREGVVYPGKNNSGFSFSLLNFKYQADAGFAVDGAGANGFGWSFDGVLNDESGSLTGKLIFDQQDIAYFLSNPDYSGYFDAVFNLDWSVSKPLQLTGEFQGATGSFQSESFSFFWDRWHLSDVVLSDWQINEAAKSLILNKARLEFSKSRISSLMSWLEDHPLRFARVDMADLQVRLSPERAEKFGFSDAVFRLKGNKERTQFTGKPVSGGVLSLIDDAAGGYQVVLDNVTPDSLGLSESTQRHRFAHRRYHFSYNSQSGVGRLSFRQQGKADSYSLLERLLFNADGLAELTFVDKAVRLLNLKSVIGKQFSAQLQAVEDMPFTYLSGLSSKPLVPYFEHIPGRSDLSLSGEQNLIALKEICALRPGLNWELAPAFSDIEDWPDLARNELEKTVSNLSSDVSGSPEEDAREKLVEQLYLVTQKRKMPDVGLVTKEERIQQAEQWLVESWPKNQELIEQLLVNRKEDLVSRFEKNGLPQVTILPDDQEQDLPRSQLSVK